MSAGKIYKITNQINKKIYIGKTIKSLPVRFREHITTAKRWLKEDAQGINHPYNSRLYPSMNKYGYDNFTIELVEELFSSECTLESREKYWIFFYNSTNDAIGYNISPGGLGGPLFAGHKQSDHCKTINSIRNKGTIQDPDFVYKRSIARARQLQSLETGEIFSILDFPKGYFYSQKFSNYRIYKSGGKFFACLESPHNRLPALSTAERNFLLAQLKTLFAERLNNSLAAMQAAQAAISKEERQNISNKVKQTKQQQRKERIENYLRLHNIDKETYINTYLKYKNNCPNRHLELIYKIPYHVIRDINNYLSLFGGGSGHKGGKVTIEENN